MKSRVSGYGMAVVAVVAAAAISWSLSPILETRFYTVTFFGAVVCAAWIGGRGPGLLAVGLSTLLVNFLFFQTLFRFSLAREALLGTGLFALAGMACVMLASSLHVTRARANQAERNLRGILGSIVDDFLAFDRDWRITFINPHTLALARRTLPEVEGKVLWEEFPQLVGTEIEAAYRQVMTERKPLRCESVGPVTGRFLDLSIYPTENGIAVYGRDVSAIRQAEENARFIAEASRLLAQSLSLDENLHQVAVLAVPRLADWCFVDLLEPGGFFRKVAIRNANADKDWIREELLRNYVPDLVRPHPLMQAYRTREAELVPAVTEAWLRSRARDERHLELLRAMGVRSWMSIPLIVQQQLLGVLTLASAESDRVYSTFDLQNAQALAAHIGLAISNSRLYRDAQLELHERTQVEQALRDSEGRFRTLVTATGAIVWRMAPDGSAIDEPAGWEQVTGQDYSQLKEDPRGWFTRIHPGDVHRVQNAWAQAQSAKRMVELEFRLRRRDGNYRRMHTVGVPLLDEAGGIQEWIGTSIDVHDRREAEEQLQRAQRMETVGRLAGGVAHETNNQMMVILSFVEFLLRGANLTEEQRGDVAQLGQAAERVAALTRQLLALSGRQVLDTRVLDLDSIVTEAESVLRRTLGPEIHLSVKFEAGPKWIMADRTQLVQILVNLALNARDAIRGSGELTISTRRSDKGPIGGRLATVWNEPGVALLSVADSGVGMELPTLNRIFEPFFSTKPMGKGTGLGLSVVEGIVSQSGGDIWVESKPGYGTVVTIGLPLTEQVEDEVAEDELVPASGGTETILVVDDEEQVRRLLIRGLRLGDYRVLEASGGQEAIAMLEQEGGNVQLVVTDVAMPSMSGLELARRSGALWPQLPFIFISGHPYEVVVHDHEIISHGRFLQKPFKVDILLTIVRSALDDSIRLSNSDAYRTRTS